MERIHVATRAPENMVDHLGGGGFVIVPRDGVDKIAVAEHVDTDCMFKAVELPDLAGSL